MRYDDFIERWSDLVVEKSDILEQAKAIADAAKELQGEDLERACNHLAAQIKEGDELSVEIIRLAELKELVSTLEEAVITTTGHLRVRIVKAISSLGNATGLEDYLIEVLDESGIKEAVDALADYRGQHVIEALLRAIDSPKQNVRFRVVVVLFQVAEIECTDEEGFGRVQALLESNHYPLRAVGVDWFRKVIERKSAGKPYDELAKELVLFERSEGFEQFFEKYGEQDDELEILSDDDRELLQSLSSDESFRAEYAFLRDIFEGKHKAFPCLDVLAGELTKAAAEHMAKWLAENTKKETVNEFDGEIPTHVSPLEETVANLRQRFVEQYAA